MTPAIALLSAQAAVSPSRLDELVGTWKGASVASPFVSEAEVKITREGNVYVVDLTRKDLLTKANHERIYLEAGPTGLRGVSDPDYVSEPRRDRGQITDRGIAMKSDPWEVGLRDPMTLSWSLELGEYREAIRARIYIDTPTFHPNANILTLSWFGDWKSGTSNTQYKFYRQGVLAIIR